MNLFPTPEMVAIVRRLIAVIQFGREIVRVVGVEDRGVAVFRRPDNPIRGSIRRDRRSRARIAKIRVARRGGRGAQFRIREIKGFQLVATAPM